MSATTSPPQAQRTASERTPDAADEPRTLVEVFEHATRKYPKPDALSYKQDGSWHAVSSAELIGRARAIARGLHALGLRRGDRAALLSANCIEWTLTDAGCIFGGVVDVPIYTTQAPTQVRYILDDSGARVLFIQNRAAFDRIASEIAHCQALEHIVFFETAIDAGDHRAMSLAQLEERGGAHTTPAGEAPQTVQPEDLATIIYTSGTTGEPKGVMLTHTNLVTNLVDSAGHLTFNAQDISLSVLPLSHVYERLAMYMYIYHGMSVYYAESIEKFSDNLLEVKPTIMLGVPRLFEKIFGRAREKALAGGRAQAAIFAWAVEIGKQWARLKYNHQRVPPLLGWQHQLADRLVFRKFRAAMGGRIRLFISGGAALPEEIGYVYAGAGMQIVQGYGLTETSPVISAGSPSENRIGTVGRPIANVEVRFAPDGEIEVRGPNVMRGYYNKPEATRAAFTEDGWFKTGDIGALDADGFLRITDRKKELIKTSGGKYIAPQRVEERIKASRFVNQVILIGDGRHFPAALIVPDWEQLRSYATLKGLDIKTPADFCQHPRIVDLFERQVKAMTEDLSQFERVKKIALLEREFTIEGGELTPTLKVKRRVVDEKYRAVIDRLYAVTSDK
ncbi:MAG: long-chain fatty acid--CoA ligase [Pyrinomonadaceae bacterium]